jgi:hypothetical protein
MKINSGRRGELPHEMLLRAALSGELDGAKLTKRERIDALKATSQYYTPEAFAVEVARVIHAVRPER